MNYTKKLSMRKITLLFSFFISHHFLWAQSFSHTAKPGPESTIYIPNGNFEVPNLPSGTFQYGPVNGTGWLLNGLTAIARNNSAFNPGQPAPHGSQVLVIQKTGIAEKSFTVSSNGFYRLAMKAAQRGTNKQTVELRLNGEVIQLLKPDGSSYKTYYSVPVYLPGGTQTLRITGLNPQGGDNSAFIDNIRLEKLRTFNDPNTWLLSGLGSPVPNTGAVVSIPASSAVVMAGACQSKTINVYGQLLGSINRNLQLHSNGIFVLGSSALLEIGREGIPYKQKATIELNGAPTSGNLNGFMMGSKVLGAMGGATINLHGAPVVSWTQLDQIAFPDDPSLHVKEPVNWKAGDKIVIASTDFDMRHAEEFNILGISADQRTIKLQPKISQGSGYLEHKHYGHLQSYESPGGQTWKLDERAEVGLLSRSITIQGDATSANTFFGGHMMVMGNAKAYVSSVEFFRMGQRKILGRYPFHWHGLQNAGEGQYIKNSSIHHTYNRAVTIHATNGTLVDNNVAYHNLGHAFFMEDGDEVKNKITNNLGLVTISPGKEYGLLPSDYVKARNISGPSTFWITNPQNEVTNNRAGGSDGSGFWLAPHNNPVGLLSGNDNYDPNVLPFDEGAFDNNTAHSSYHGWIIGGAPLHGDETQTPNENNDYLRSTNFVAEFKNITVFKNLLGTYSRIGMNSALSKYRNLIVADNYKGDATTWLTDYHNVLWVGGSKNYEPYPVNADAIGGAKGLVHLHTIYDGPCRVYDSYFADVNKPHMSLFDQWGANIKYAGHTFERSYIEEESYQVNFRGIYDRPVWYTANAIDLDGKLTGKPMTSISQDHRMLTDHQSKRIQPDKNGAESNHRFAYVEIVPSDEGMLPTGQSTRQKSTIIRSDGVKMRDYTKEIQGICFVPVIGKDFTYKLILDKQLPANIRFDFHSLNTGDHIIIGVQNAPGNSKVSYTSAPGVSGSGAVLTQVTNLATLKLFNGSCWTREGNVTYLKYKAPAGSSIKDGGIQGSLIYCNDMGCNPFNNVLQPDSDGDGVVDNEELAMDRNPLDAKDFGFDFFKESKEWSQGFIDAQCVGCDENWVLLASPPAGQPYIEKGGFHFSGNVVKSIAVYLKSENTGALKLRWRTNGQNSYSTTHVAYASYSTANQERIIRFDVENHPFWKNKIITDLKLELHPASGHTWIKWIRHENKFLYGINKWGSTKTEILHADGRTFKKYDNINANNSSFLSKNTSRQFGLLDYNNDGVTDVLSFSGTTSTFRIDVADGKNYNNSLYNLAPTWLTGGYSNYRFFIADYNNDGTKDLWLFKHKNTSSVASELKIYSTVNSGLSFPLYNSTTALHQVTNPNDRLLVGDYNGDSKQDIWYVKANTTSNKTEVHILNGALSFNAFMMHIATPLPANTGNWEYTITDYNGDGTSDLVAINKQGASGFVEITILSGKSNFLNVLSEKKITDIPVGMVNNNWSFHIDQNSTVGQIVLKKEWEATSAPIEEVKEENLMMYPNPAKNKLFINYTGQELENVQVALYSLKGEAVLQRNLAHLNHAVLDVSTLSKGIYLVKITDNSGFSAHKKMIIR